MANILPIEALRVLDMRFGCDSEIALATVDEQGNPWVRTVNAYYESGCFYVVTHALSNKMRQIAENPAVAISGDWFSARGTGEGMGHILHPKNTDLADKLRAVFAEWYDNGHTDETDPNTVILRIRLTQGTLFSNGTRWDLDFN